MRRATRREVLKTSVGVAAASAVAGRADAAGAAGDGREFVLADVAVVDTVRRRLRRGMSVYVRNGRVAGFGRTGSVAVEAGVEVVDGAGKYVIPGLVDAHVHSVEFAEVSPPLYLACGVTTVREMWGTATLRRWRDRVADGGMLGPRSIVASSIVDGASSLGQGEMFTIVSTGDQARRAVRQARRDGADFVKVHSRLPDELHRVVANEARRWGIAVVGHCPDDVPLSTACARGQRSFEHLYGLFFDMSSRQAEIRAALGELEFDDVAGYGNAIFALEWLAVHSHSQARADQVLTRLARLRTTMVPTLAVYSVLDRPGDLDPADERLRYVPASIRQYWPWALDNRVKAGRGPRDVERRYRMLDYRRELVGALYEAGVPVLAGTDAGDVPYLYPGFSLHEELAELVAAGLTPAQALAAATIDAARFLGLDDEIGSVATGKVADLVVLDANPLADIRNTTRIDSVVVRGRRITAAGRRRMLSDVADAATSLLASGLA